MKKSGSFYLLVVFTAINFHSLSQTFGLKGGLNMTGMDYWLAEPKTITTGINLGATACFKISDTYEIETGIIFNNRGFKQNSHGQIDTITRLRYIDSPVNFKYRINLKSNRLYMVGGPYVAFGISGFHEWKYNGESYRDQEKWKFVWVNNQLKRFDFGINLGVEYEFGNCGLGFQYGHGFVNIRKGGNSHNYLKNRLLSVFFAYRFKRKTETNSNMESEN